MRIFTVGASSFILLATVLQARPLVTGPAGAAARCRATRDDCLIGASPEFAACYDLAIRPEGDVTIDEWSRNDCFSFSLDDVKTDSTRECQDCWAMVDRKSEQFKKKACDAGNCLPDQKRAIKRALTPPINPACIDAACELAKTCVGALCRAIGVGTSQPANAIAPPPQAPQAPPSPVKSSRIPVLPGSNAASNFEAAKKKRPTTRGRFPVNTPADVGKGNPRVGLANSPRPKAQRVSTPSLAKAPLPPPVSKPARGALPMEDPGDGIMRHYYYNQAHGIKTYLPAGVDFIDGIHG